MKTLSDKITVGKFTNVEMLHILDTEDVKEAVKQLKDELINDDDEITYILHSKIDEIFGEKLI